MMDGGCDDFGSSSSRNGAGNTTNSAYFQQGQLYSGSYALPGAFSDAGQTPSAVFSSVGTSTPMILDNTPPRPPAAVSVAWGGAAPAAPRVLFAQGFGQQQLHSEVSDGKLS